MKISNRRRMDDRSSHNVWRSYSDMMSGLLLLFVLIMAVCLMQAQKNYTEKLAEQAKQLQTQSALEESQTQVGLQQAQLEKQQTELNEQSSKLKQQEQTLAEQASALQELQDALENQRIQLVQKESELNDQNTLLQTQAQQLADSKTALDEANNLMQEQQQRIEQIDTQTGAILLDSSVLFDFNESVLTENGTQILDTVLPVYCKVLLDSEYADYVAEIIIDGYTDTIGDYVTNLSLSQQRAYAVAEYLIYAKDTFLSQEESDQLIAKLSTNGKSMSNPVKDNFGNVDDDASRRVEIKFRLRDEEMLSELQELVTAGQKQAAAASAQAENAQDAFAVQEGELPAGQEGEGAVG